MARRKRGKDLKMYRIDEYKPTGEFRIVSERGDLAQTTDGPFITRDRALAEEAVEYLNQPHPGLGKRRGSHRIKSMFGAF